MMHYEMDLYVKLCRISRTHILTCTIDHFEFLTWSSISHFWLLVLRLLYFHICRLSTTFRQLVDAPTSTWCHITFPEMNTTGCRQPANPSDMLSTPCLQLDLILAGSIWFLQARSGPCRLDRQVVDRLQSPPRQVVDKLWSIHDNLSTTCRANVQSVDKLWDNSVPSHPPPIASSDHQPFHRKFDHTFWERKDRARKNYRR